MLTTWLNRNVKEMTLTTRKARPIKREGQVFRDDRLFIVACDDTYAPKQYFDFFEIARVKVAVIPTDDGASVAKHVLDRLVSYEHEADDQLWMLLDTDHCLEPNHIKGFLEALQDARQRNVRVALSRPCFEFWLLLHHEEPEGLQDEATAAEVEKRLKAGIGGYDKTNLQREKFPLESVIVACARAEKLDIEVRGGDVPERPTSRVYQLWKAIAEAGLPSQLPPELAKLVNR
jgi:hypothetical protein